ncbi:mitogen-activated protein kinase kinase 2-like isoform X3 [Panicum miliaceum]|uniref:mitogen-activated protein kinase kinase n=1 Tax=Panicum miliaceum TaxID=4540 RepID=A0A3L6S3G3_PANMI|nr:mitogen-activated protein kinase kinase 2-like isoform X3 [Panicum miliaceum]
MADRYRAYAPHSSYDRDPRGGYPEYHPPEGSLASYYASGSSILPGGPPDVLRNNVNLLGGPDVLRNNVALQPRAYSYGSDGPVVVNPAIMNPAVPGLSGLPAVARAHGPSPLEDPSLAGLSGLAPARALGPSILEESAVMGRSSSLGKGAGIPDVEHHSPLPNLDRPSEHESNILFVDCLPTDCTRREVAHLFRPFDGFKDIRVVHKEPRRSGDKAYVLCFVEFENAKCARAAMHDLRGYRFDDQKPDSPFLKIQFARTHSGTFRDGDLLVNKDGLRIVSQGEGGEAPPIEPLDNQLSLDDLDIIKVIGKGSSGHVQLVRHKFTGQFFALKILKGLMYLHHERRIIHRDLKPSNILINHRGEVKISDFGVSAIISSSSGQRDTFIGTKNYMAPERINGKKHGYMSDIWSLGLVILECATGNFPFPPCDSFYELLTAIVDQQPPSAPADQFSPEFCSFISACIQKDAKDRSSAQALLNHPYLSMYDDLHIDLASYFTTAGSPLATFK